MQRSPPWPSTPTFALPEKDVADKLVDGYLRTIETVYRVLNISNFREQYNALWSSTAEPDMAFTIQLKLVLAIGAIVYDDQFSLRTSAVRWVHEAQTWLLQPVYKSRLTIQSLQTEILFLFARELVAVGGELVYISAGSLFRAAVHMGLHRDPSQLANMAPLAAEMRRRLWNTVLEITLQSSMDSGGPPFISLDDFDTAPPGNFDDQQLMTDNPIPKPDTCYTQTSISIALRKSFPLRLAIAKFLNNIDSKCSYDETLSLDRGLRSSYKSLRQSLQAYTKKASPAFCCFEIGAVHMIMGRYHIALHVPFFAPSLQDASYAFSRQAVTEAALKIWGVAQPSALVPAPTQTDTSSPHEEEEQVDLIRFAVCGAGFFRTIVLQASYLITAELRAELHDNQGLGLVHVRRDFFSVLEHAKSLTISCTEAGETNIKHYLLLSVLSAQVDGLMQGLPRAASPQLLIDTAKVATATCAKLLEHQALRFDQDAIVEGERLDQMLWGTSSTFVEGWEFMVRQCRVQAFLDYRLTI